MSCNAIHEILPSNRLSVAHLPDGKRLNLAEKHEWESDQQVVKTAKLVALLAVFLCGTFWNGTLGVFGLTALWNVCLLGSCHGNLSGWRVVASGFWRLMLPHLLIVQVHGIEWGYLSLKSRENLVASGVWKLEVSGWRWSLGLWKTWGGLLQGVTAAYCCTLDSFFANVNDGLSPSGFWKAQPFGGYLVIRTLSSERSRQLISVLQSIFIKTLGEFLVCLCTSSFCSCEGAGSVMLVLEKAFSSLFFSCFVILLYFSIRLDQVGVSRHGARDNSSVRIDLTYLV